MGENMKEVNFHFWCQRCEHYVKKAIEMPCSACLEVPAREESTKPERWEESSKYKPVDKKEKNRWKSIGVDLAEREIGER